MSGRDAERSTPEGKKTIQVGMISLGCAKNRVDAERILGGIAARG